MLAGKEARYESGLNLAGRDSDFSQIGIESEYSDGMLVWKITVESWEAGALLMVLWMMKVVWSCRILLTYTGGKVGVGNLY